MYHRIQDLLDRRIPFAYEIAPPVNIAIWNATGLPKDTIDYLLTHLQQTNITFITETWLLSPNRFPTSWTQYHTYALPIPNTPRGQMGLTLLINPSNPYPTSPVTIPNHQYPSYTISCTFGEYLIHCVYLPPSLSHDTAIDILESLPLEHSSTTNTIICGDFNARLGTVVGDRDTTIRGYRIRTWMESYGLHLWNAELAKGQPTFIRHNGSSIIDLFFSTQRLLNAQMVIQDEASLDSDHKITHLIFDTNQSPPQQNPPPRRQWKLYRLSDPTTRQSYIDHFNTNSRDLTSTLANILEPTDTQPNVDKLTHQLNKAFYTSLDIAIGAKNPFSRPSRHKWFWNEDIQKAMDHREYCYKKWRKANSLSKVHWWIKHQEARALVRLKVNKRRAETWRSFCSKLDNGDFNKALATISKIKRNRTLQPTYTHPEGPDMAAQTMADHLKAVFSGNHMHSQTPNILPYIPSCNADTTPDTNPNPVNDDQNDPFTTEQVTKAIERLPTNKAPGADHIRSEMIKPVTHLVAPLLTSLFNLCWRTSQVPTLWRVAQVVPIYKHKGTPNDPANYRPISLTSVFRKLLETCLHQDLLELGPPLDIVQGGFRAHRGALDQARCLHELSILHNKHYGSPPVLAFLDIKSAYDTVDRRIIWQALTPHISTHFLALLKKLFDDVFIEVLLSNSSSARFQPVTGVLQGSVLSPLLYSYYIDSLPTFVREAENEMDPDFQHNPSTTINGRTINSLLYADDVVILGTWQSIPHLLAACERHSNLLGYRWNPTKCVMMSAEEKPQGQRDPTLYDVPIPFDSSFPYLGVQFKANGTLDPEALIHSRTKKALTSMRMLRSIGLRPSGLGKLLACRLYRQFIRPQMEYGIAIQTIGKKLRTVLDNAQSNSLRMIYGASAKASTQVMCHMANLPRMEDRVTILQAKFILRAHNQPSDSLLHQLRQIITPKRTGTSSWRSLLQNNIIWMDLPSPRSNTNRNQMKGAIRTFLHNRLQIYKARRGTKLLNACRPFNGIDPILWLPMSINERSRCVRWRIGWLPGGKPKPCPRCREQKGTVRNHLIHCLNMHARLKISNHIEDPLSWILNRLPKTRPRRSNTRHYWCSIWPAVCLILDDLENIQHPEYEPQSIYSEDPPGHRLVQWLSQESTAIPSPSDSSQTASR